MSPGILGKKIGMSQVFRPDGQVVPVTLLKAGPCVVVQRKTPTSDGYDAVQLGFVEFAKASRATKPMAGHLKKAGADGVKYLREIKMRPGDDDLKQGDRVLVDQFKPTDKVDVIQAPSFQRRPRVAWLDVPPRAGIDWRFQLSFARISRNSHGRAQRRAECYGAESGSGGSGGRG